MCLLTPQGGEARGALRYRVSSVYPPDVRQGLDVLIGIVAAAASEHRRSGHIVAARCDRCDGCIAIAEVEGPRWVVSCRCGRFDLTLASLSPTAEELEQEFRRRGKLLTPP